MNSILVLDACTIVNLARIDEDDFLEDKVKALKAYAVAFVLDEVKKRYVPSDKTSKRQIFLVPYWGGLTRIENKDVEELVESVRTVSGYSQRPNGELYSTALSLYLSRMEGEKVLFFTDDFPAKADFNSCFEFQQIGYIGDSVDLLVTLYWLSPKGQFTKDELEKYLTALRGEYASRVKELQNKIDHYASTLTTSKKELRRKYEMEGLSNALKSGQPLTDTISKCEKFFESDKSTLGKQINKILRDFKDYPEIVEKVGRTVQYIDRYGIYKI